MRLRLSDDRILHNTVGKTPVMVLQEHCHKHEGQTPTYSTVMNRATTASRGHSSHVVTVVCGSGASSQSVTEHSDKKKEAKQRAALKMLRRLYPHVELWGELVESTNSRQREERVDRNNKMREKHAALASASANAGGDAETGAAGGDGGATGGGDAAVAVGAATSATASCGAAGSGAAGSGAAEEVGRSRRRTLASNPLVALKMLAVVKERLWERLAEINSHEAAGAARPISIKAQPMMRAVGAGLAGAGAAVAAGAGPGAGAGVGADSEAG